MGSSVSDHRTWNHQHSYWATHPDRPFAWTAPIHRAVRHAVCAPLTLQRRLLGRALGGLAVRWTLRTLHADPAPIRVVQLHAGKPRPSPANECVVALFVGNDTMPKIERWRDAVRSSLEEGGICGRPGCYRPSRPVQQVACAECRTRPSHQIAQKGCRRACHQCRQSLIASSG